MSSGLEEEFECHSDAVTAGGRLVIKDELVETGHFQAQIVGTPTDTTEEPFGPTVGTIIIATDESGLVVELTPSDCRELAWGLLNVADEKTE